MKTLVRKNNITNVYELVIIDESGNTQVTELVDRPKNEPYTLILPTNPSNRKYFNSKKVDAAGGEIELSYKATITLGSRPEGTTQRKSLEDYLNDEDKATYLALIEKAKKAREEANKKQPMTELEKAQRAYERALANYNRLMGLNDEEEVND